MKITTIDRVLNNEATAEEARQVAEWFTTSEGSDYLSQRIEEESIGVTPEIARAWVNHSIRHAEMKERFLNQIRTKSKNKRKRWVAAAIWIPIIILTSSVIFLADRTGVFSPMEYAEIQVPCGEQMRVLLQDGTIIQLNSDSHLRYPKKFGLFNRIVELNGEAYFEVASNKNYPFIIDLKEIQVKVTGTKFNIRAYPTDSSIWVTLEEGNVVIKDPHKNQNYPLIPGECAEYNRHSGICQVIKPIDMESVSAWRSNSLNFYMTPLSEIINVLERQYDVHFHVPDSTLLNYRFVYSTGKINISDILQDLEKVSSIRFFEKEDGTYEILSKK